MSYRVRWNTPITLFPNRCCLQLGAVFSLVRASARWKRCNLTAYRLYNWCRSWHECVPSCRHAEILRLNRKISTGVRKSNSVSELLWSQLSSVSTNWTSEPLLCPSPAASFPTSDFQSLRITFPKQERGTLSEGESLWKNAGLLGIKAMIKKDYRKQGRIFCWWFYYIPNVFQHYLICFRHATIKLVFLH